MDSLEVIRQRAAKLHADAVAKGGDPLDTYEFVRNEAARREIQVVRVARGDARLRGGQAIFDSDAYLILHHDSEDLFMDAFLAAHELGHLEVESIEESSVSFSPDPYRSSEPAPVGTDRVIDYSHRQRHEIQMDLFGREFILPRYWARKLHLEEGLTAEQIASRLKAPYPFVAQQLLDALLLPQVESLPDEHKKELKLSDEQKIAVSHRGTPYLLEAGPGSGKTKTLVGRIDSLLKDGCDPSKILVLTFSNKAAGELMERVMHARPDVVQTWIGTFHSFGYDIIKRFHDRLGLPPDPRLLARTEQLEMLEGIYFTLGLRHFRDIWDPTYKLNQILNAVSRANDEVVDGARYHELALITKSKAVSDEEKEAAEKLLEIARVFQAYESVKLREGSVDFGDLVTMPVRIFELSVELRSLMVQKYEHVLVDEYQDVNRSSVRLLQAITTKGKNLWVVGDSKQSIYRFRGASSFNMQRFVGSDFQQGESFELPTNYRSTEEIVEVSTSFGNGMNVNRNKASRLISARGKCGAVPEHLIVRVSEDETCAIADKIEEMKEVGYKLSDQAILCSGNDRLANIAQGLERLGIPVLSFGNLFERSEIRDLLSLLSLIVDRKAVALVRVSTISTVNLSIADCDSVLAFLKENNFGPLTWLGRVDEIPELSEAGLTSLKQLGEILANFEVHSSPWTVLATILFDRTRWAATISQSTDAISITRGIAIWQFMNFVRNQPRGNGLPIRRLLDRIRKLVLLADDRDLRQLPACASSIDAVRLLTMHGSKGLEFPVVHLPGLNVESIPQYTNKMLARITIPPDGVIEGISEASRDALGKSLDEEQECLFYVALSRAEDRLFLYSSAEKSDGAARRPSPFIARLKPKIKESRYVPKSSLPIDGNLMVPVSLVGKLIFSDHQLQLYNKCPRRFLYTHILGVSGGRTETPFMKLHSAAQDLIDLIVADLAYVPSGEEIDSKLKDGFQGRDLDPLGAHSEFFAVARSIIDALLTITLAFSRTTPEPMRVAFGDIQVEVTPDQILTETGGKKVVRRIKSGHKPSSPNDNKDLSEALLHIAAIKAHPNCDVEIAYLSDGTARSIALTDRVMKNRTGSINALLDQIRRGYYPPEQTRTCPLCPAYFYCDKVPSGDISKNLPQPLPLRQTSLD